MSVHYCFIARDSDMVVFENLVNKDLKQSQLKDEAIEILVSKEKEVKDVILKMNSSVSSAVDEETKDDSLTWFEPLPRITGGVELHLMLHSGIFFGIVTELKYNEDKAKRFLTDLLKELTILYKGNVKFIQR